MLPENYREVIKALSNVQSQSHWGLSINNFINNVQHKSSNDVNRLLKEIKEANNYSPSVMQSILGDAYNTVISFQLPTDFAPSEDEGLE